jgi:hypothetical protein
MANYINDPSFQKLYQAIWDQIDSHPDFPYLLESDVVNGVAVSGALADGYSEAEKAAFNLIRAEFFTTNPYDDLALAGESNQGVLAIDNELAKVGGTSAPPRTEPTTPANTRRGSPGVTFQDGGLEYGTQWLTASINPENKQVITIEGMLSSQFTAITANYDIELNFVDDLIPPKKVGLENDDTAYEVAAKIRNLINGIPEEEGFSARVESQGQGYATVTIKRTLP